MGGGGGMDGWRRGGMEVNTGDGFGLRQTGRQPPSGINTDHLRGFHDRPRRVDALK